MIRLVMIRKLVMILNRYLTIWNYNKNLTKIYTYFCGTCFTAQYCCILRPINQMKELLVLCTEWMWWRVVLNTLCSRHNPIRPHHKWPNRFSRQLFLISFNIKLTTRLHQRQNIYTTLAKFPHMVALSEDAAVLGIRLRRGTASNRSRYIQFRVKF